MRASFCPYCGLKLIKKEIGDEGLVPFCPKCNKPLFDHMIPCVIIICYTVDNKIVLAHEPNSPLPYVLIAGYTKNWGKFGRGCKKRSDGGIRSRGN